MVILKRDIVNKMAETVLNNPAGSLSTRLDVENAILTLRIIDRLYAEYLSCATHSRNTLNRKLLSIMDTLDVSDPLPSSERDKVQGGSKDE